MNQEKNIMEKNDIPLIIPSNIPRVYANGVLGGFNNCDFRLLLFSDEPLEQDEILLPQDLNVMREVQAEVILSPLAAKKISKWLTKYVEEFEKKIGHIPEPQLNDGD
jgi:hypothetical protein